MCSTAKAAAAFTLFCVGLTLLILAHTKHSRLNEERPDVPSPRTNWSSKSPVQMQRWYMWHARLVKDAHQSVALEAPSQRRLVFVGDSIFERLGGTSLGSPTDKAKGVPATMRALLGSRWPVPPLLLAAAGDQTQHVLWRLMHGELPVSLRRDPSLNFIMHVGTNNLGRGHSPEQTAAGVEAVARWLLHNTQGLLLLTTLLPRGDGATTLPHLCPPRCSDNGLPFTSFLPAVNQARAGSRAALPAAGCNRSAHAHSRYM